MAVTCRVFLRSSVAGLALLAASAAHGVVYKWVEEDGKVIYSNEPPSDPGKVQEFTRIDDLDLVPLDKRPRDSAAAEPEKPSSPSAVATPAPATPPPREPVTLLPRDPTASARDIETPPPRVIPRSTHTGAVQDPCLTSPDPRCHERNKGNYHPYLGYSPNGPVPQAVGASNAAAAGGTVGGQVSAGQAAAPKRGAQPLPPGSAPAASINWSR
jgi:hypothetical protein